MFRLVAIDSSFPAQHRALTTIEINPAIIALREEFGIPADGP
jgi:hypothetical protein